MVQPSQVITENARQTEKTVQYRYKSKSNTCIKIRNKTIFI